MATIAPERRAYIAVICGEVRLAATELDGTDLQSLVAEPGFQAIVAVPIKTAGRLLFQKWPELEELLAATEDASTD